MKAKPEPCRCGAMNFPHRYSHWCDMWLSTREDDQDSVYEWDDQERRLDERDRATYVNELNRGAAK